MNPVLSCFLVNGEALDASAVFHSEKNRSFLFGDGVFETMRMEQGRLLFSALHFNRLKRSLNALGIETEGLPQPEDLEKLIGSRVNLPSLRVKLLAYRESLGAYVPETNKSGIYLQAFPFTKPLSFSDQGLTVGIYEEQKKISGALSWMKSTSSLLYVMAGIHAQKQGWDDCILLNDQNELMEGSSSNLFALMDGRWITPPISSGCIEGVFRRALMDVMDRKGIPFAEVSITKQDALRADELILTNAVSGIRWIERFGEKTYRCEEARRLYETVSALS